MLQVNHSTSTMHKTVVIGIEIQLREGVVGLPVIHGTRIWVQ